eukprot:TRINITY_DN5364_c0_g1_i1.p1 TRINITY_DN5364_c0_g1~~TRINITY_DN5364_c0_g1_i1.p1  ORF type:complete len:540 (+),score=117.22 TRINITY_DN5364_c0_g1_i1:51-1670(+)
MPAAARAELQSPTRTRESRHQPFCNGTCGGLCMQIPLVTTYAPTGSPGRDTSPRRPPPRSPPPHQYTGSAAPAAGWGAEIQGALDRVKALAERTQGVAAPVWGGRPPLTTPLQPISAPTLGEATQSASSSQASSSPLLETEASGAAMVGSTLDGRTVPEDFTYTGSLSLGTSTAAGEDPQTQTIVAVGSYGGTVSDRREIETLGRGGSLRMIVPPSDASAAMRGYSARPSIGQLKSAMSMAGHGELLNETAPCLVDDATATRTLSDIPMSASFVLQSPPATALQSPLATALQSPPATALQSPPGTALLRAEFSIPNTTSVGELPGTPGEVDDTVALAEEQYQSPCPSFAVPYGGASPPASSAASETLPRWTCPRHNREYTLWCCELGCNTFLCELCASQDHPGHHTIPLPTQASLDDDLHKLLDGGTTPYERTVLASGIVTKREAQRGGGGIQHHVADEALDLLEHTADSDFDRVDSRLSYLSGMLSTTCRTWTTINKRNLRAPSAVAAAPADPPPLYGRGMNAIAKENRHLMERAAGW